jgi:hypothetical protein
LHYRDIDKSQLTQSLHSTMRGLAEKVVFRLKIIQIIISRGGRVGDRARSLLDMVPHNLLS